MSRETRGDGGRAAHHGSGDGESRVSRRSVLRGAGVALTTVGVGGVVGVVAGDVDHWGAQPDHVTVSDDPELIRPYQPRLHFDALDVDYEPLGFYGLHAESPEHDENVVVGFHQYAQQDDIVSFTSHPGDHEPVYVFYDPVSGDVTKVIYSGYHWYKGTAYRGSVKLEETSDGERPVLRAFEPWNHHIALQPEEPDRSELYDTRSLIDNLDSWLVNGLQDDLRESQPLNPWRMQEKDHWWQDSSMTALEEILVRFWVGLGIGDVPERPGWDE